MKADEAADMGFRGLKPGKRGRIALSLSIHGCGAVQVAAGSVGSAEAPVYNPGIYARDLAVIHPHLPDLLSLQ